jgi:fucose permease
MKSQFPASPSRALSFRIVFLQYSGFLTIGVVLSLLGPLIPLIRSDLHLSYGLAGVFFPAQSIGSITVLVFSSFLMHILEKRKVLFAGCCVFLTGLLCCALAPGLPVLLLGNILLGAGVATFEIGFNTLCIDSHPTGKGKALNRLHFFFGAGAVMGPLLALAVEHSGAGEAWRWALGLSAAGPLLVLGVLCFTPLPPSPPAQFKKRFAVLSRPLLWFAAVALCLYCGVEWGVGAWFPSYWNKTALAVVLPPALVTSLFWLTFSAGRFVGGHWADRWGFRRFLTVSMLGALVIIVLWFFIREPVIALGLVLCLGFIISGIYPTIVALGSHKFPSSSGQVAGFLSVFGVVGGAVFPSVVGFWADSSGIGALVGVELIIVVLMIAVALLAFAADRKQGMM